MNCLKFNKEKSIITVNPNHDVKAEYLYVTPTKAEEIPMVMLKNMANDIQLAPYHSLIAIIGIPEISSFANNKTNRFSNVKPIFLACSAHARKEMEFVSGINVGDSISIASSDIEMGIHVYCKSNKLTANIINTIGNKYTLGKDTVMIINTKIVPDSAINGIINENNTYAKGIYDLGFCNKDGVACNWNKATKVKVMNTIQDADLLKDDNLKDFSKLACHLYEGIRKDSKIKINIPTIAIYHKQAKEIISQLSKGMMETGIYDWKSIDVLKTIANNCNNYYPSNVMPSKDIPRGGIDLGSDSSHLNSSDK